MRIGIIGQAGKSSDDLRRAIDLLLTDTQIKQIIYLGDDDAVDAVLRDFARESLGEDEFLRRGAELACAGSADDIEGLLAEDRAAQRLSLLRRLPEPPARAIEMLEKWIVLAVHDKAILDEDDVANAHVIVYGKAPEADFKRFGPRSFLTPGPLRRGRVGRIALRADGGLDVSLLDLQGNAVLRESIAPALAKIVVTS
jgi:Arc/MetJ family transcription regulator